MSSLYLENSIIGSLFLFSIFFYGNTVNAMLADLTGHNQVGFSVVPISSFSSPEFLVSGNVSLLKQLLWVFHDEPAFLSVGDITVSKFDAVFLFHGHAFHTDENFYVNIHSLASLAHPYFEPS